MESVFLLFGEDIGGIEFTVDVLNGVLFVMDRFAGGIFANLKVTNVAGDFFLDHCTHPMLSLYIVVGGFRRSCFLSRSFIM